MTQTAVIRTSTAKNLRECPHPENYVYKVPSINRTARLLTNQTIMLILLFIVYTINNKIEFDPDKSEKNFRERGLPFHIVRDFDFETALVQPDDRHAYPEPRYVSIGDLNNRLHVVCFTSIAGGIRVISLRKANSREVKRYEQRQKKS